MGGASLRNRESIEARLTSDAGEQRFGRAFPTPLSRVTLLSREAPSLAATLVRWRERRFVLELESGEPLHVLTNGLTFTRGSTRLEWLEVRREFPADVARERELLAHGDEHAWQVFTDELLERGDPLGFVLQRGAGEFDVPFVLEVQPLLASRCVQAERWPNGLFRELTFTLPFGREVEEGWFAAVLGHARAWMVEHVRIELGGPKRRRSPEPLAQAEAHVHRYAPPHLRSISIS